MWTWSKCLFSQLENNFTARDEGDDECLSSSLLTGDEFGDYMGDWRREHEKRRHETHLRKTKPSSLSRHKPAGGTCDANNHFYTALRLNTISHSLIKETTCSTLWNFHSVCSLSSLFFLPLSFLKTTATKKGGDEETVRARDSVLQDHFLPAWKPYCNLLDQTKRTSTAARSKIKKKRKKTRKEERRNLLKKKSM